MAAVDLITALGRLLQDGALRDAFAADAFSFVREVGLREEDHVSFLKLVPADLEFQARVLLNKRFKLVLPILPQTCGQMKDEAWEEFVRYARSNPPTGGKPALEDAFGFGRHLIKIRSSSLCHRELNRCRFVLERRRLSLHVVTPPNYRRLPSLQVLLRRRSNHWQEWLIYLGC